MNLISTIWMHAFQQQPSIFQQQNLVAPCRCPINLFIKISVSILQLLIVASNTLWPSHHVYNLVTELQRYTPRRYSDMPDMLVRWGTESVVSFGVTIKIDLTIIIRVLQARKWHFERG